jgi:hypothetical protein
MSRVWSSRRRKGYRTSRICCKLSRKGYMTSSIST